MTPLTPTGREWSVTIPAPCEWLTANKITGTYNRHARTKITAAWRAAAADTAWIAKLPTGLDYVRIDAECWFPATGRLPVRDRDNLRPTLKAAIDGLGPQTQRVRKGVLSVSPGYGLVVDDSDARLAPGGGLEIQRGPGIAPGGELRLVIVEIERAARL